MSIKIKFNSPLLIILFITIILVIGYKTSDYLLSKKTIPQKFLQARAHAGEISKKILESTYNITQKIKKINDYDLNGDSQKALELINKAIENNKKSYDLAFSLSEYLKEMTQGLKDFSSLEQQRTAQEAISLQLALIAEFINYNRLLNEFLHHLSIAISTQNSSYRKKIEEDISKINSKALIINSLNEQYHKKMEKLDKMLNLSR